jgi:ferric-dicitrate binding protein FerR (iron transport regulator)
MQHSIHTYGHYTAQELVSSPYFLEWVRFPDDTNQAFWQSYLEAYPHKASAVEAAVAIARSLHVVQDRPTPLQQREMWDEIYNNVGNNRVYARKSPFVYMARAAVAIGVIAGVSWLMFRPGKQQVSIASDFGEIKTLYLPDSTAVTLNGHSGITYNKAWAKREVWIEGEAFFNVRPDGEQQFDVHSNGVDVHVLGTSFNIRNRRGVTAVVLNTGKVMVAASDEKKLILSQPGDMARYDSQQKDLTHRKVPVAKVTGWQQHKLQLDQTSVADFFGVLEDDWGYQVQTNDSTLLNKKISGEIELTDKAVLMDALAVILDARVTQQGSTIIVTPN